MNRSNGRGREAGSRAEHRRAASARRRPGDRARRAPGHHPQRRSVRPLPMSRAPSKKIENFRGAFSNGSINITRTGNRWRQFSGCRGWMSKIRIKGFAVSIIITTMIGLADPASFDQRRRNAPPSRREGRACVKRLCRSQTTGRRNDRSRTAYWGIVGEAPNQVIVSC